MEPLQQLETVVHPEIRVVLEQTPHNWSAYVPSIPGCVATGKTQRAVQRNIRQALTLHLDHMHERERREEAVREALAAR